MWKGRFAEHGIRNTRLLKKFRTSFALDYPIVLNLFNNEDFMFHIKENRILSKENTFLAFLRKCKTGERFEDLGGYFGGSKSFHSKIFGDMIDRLVYYFRRHIQLPDKETAEMHKMHLTR